MAGRKGVLGEQPPEDICVKTESSYLSLAYTIVLSSKLVVCRWHGRRARGEVPRDARCHGKGGARRESEVLCADTALVGRHVQRLDGWMDRSVYDATGYAPDLHRLSLCMRAS